MCICSNKINHFSMHTKLKRKDWPIFMYIVRTYDLITFTIDYVEIFGDNFEQSIDDAVKLGKISKKIADIYLKPPKHEKDNRFEKQFNKDLLANDWEIVNDFPFCSA